MVLAPRLRRFEAGEPLPQIDAMDEAQLGKLLERPVDACDPDSSAVGTEPVEDLLCREAALLRRQVRDHRVPCGA